MRGRCTYYTSRRCQEIEFPANEMYHLEHEKITVHSIMKLPSSTSTSCLTFATRMTKRKGKNALSREHGASTQMNQVDTSPLRDLQTAGWAFVGLVVVDELVRFRILQLLHAPCTSCCMSPSPVCSHLSDPVVLVHPRRLIRASTIFHSGFFPLSSHCSCRKPL